MSDSKVLYRYDIKYMYSGIHEFKLNEYPVIKETRCGVWIDIDYDRKKFINLHAHKKWACETEEEALEQFKHRKLRQIKILNGQLDFARIALHHVGVRFKETQYEIIIEKW